MRAIGIVVLCVLLALQGCDRKPASVVLSGATMGTTWSVVLPSPPGPILLDTLNKAIEQELLRINQLMSTYQADSDLSLFNLNNTTELVRLDAEILFVLDASLAVSMATGGSYDVTLGRVIDLWGFGAADQLPVAPTTIQLQAASNATGYDRLIRKGVRVSKPHAQMRIDLSSLAKGYAVDRIGLLVERAGLNEYLAEIGGEIRTRGSRAEGEPWRLGIEAPNLDVALGIEVTDSNIASSGSYRNYREIDGERVSHLIDGNTFHPISHNTVAASVLHRNTMLADAWATALMVVSPEKAKTLAVEQGMDVQLTFKTESGFDVWRTPGFTALLIQNPGAARY